MNAVRPHRHCLYHGIALALLLPATAWSQQATATAPASTAVGQAAAAADDDPIDLQTVQVSGVRAALARSTELKRDASTVQDSISALELGRFPDDNVADSLSHITGVSITRTAGGEGQKVSVRGLGPEYTLTTFNNRILATDGAGRDFAYDVLPSDVISGADVVKGAQAALTEGAIGGLINLRSASPFDNKGQHAIVRAEGDHNQMSELNGRKFSATYSNTFADDTMGLLIGAVYAERKDRTDIAGNDGGWTRNPDPNDASWGGNAWGGNIDPNGNGELDPEEYGLIAPGQFRVGTVQEDKKRKAFSGKFEWRPNDDVRIVVDGLKTRLDSPQVSYQQSFYPLFAPGRWSDINVQNGIVTGFTMDNPDPEQRMNPELLNQTEHRVVDTDLFGINGSWKVNDSLTMTGDVYRSTSERKSGGQDTYVVLRMNQPNVTRIDLARDAVPNVTTTFDDGRDLSAGLANGQFNDSDFNTHYMELRGDNIKDEITGGTVAGKLYVGEWGIDSLNFGMTRTERSKRRDLVNNTLNGGADYYSVDNAINVADLGGGVLDRTLSLPNFMNKVGSRFPRSFLGFDVPNYLRSLEAYNGNPRPDGTVYDFANAAPQWNPLESYRVEEKTNAFYVQADLSGDRWSADVGVRVVSTQTRAEAWDAKIISITENGAFNYTARYADPTPVQQDGSYRYILPSGNFTWRFTDELLLRLGAAKTMARPPVDKLAPTNTTASVSWGEFTQIYGGNVDLKPYTAKQGDVSLEWYFADQSIANMAVFYKRISNQITTSWEPGQDIGVPGYLFNVMRPINGDYAKVHGLEAGLQHFWENGLGFRAQYTRNWSKSFVEGEERPLEGIAPSVYSLGLMYEKGPWSISTTADYSDGFVTATNVLGAGYNEQADEITWLTASISYEINDMFSVSLQGQNLLDEAQTYSINGNPLLSQGYYRYGRSFTLGFSARF
ncbi:TonB-dependent receptor [Stenotrophomonas chelatiphaga]|uniref:TonB-dependent receptor n=1 Tax=Stenotrophomonas chelatiphaga TaxID=517011 RepID=A0A0R0CUV6_9GAMM|nr:MULTISPECIES: TonB-dependent receptor [Stenotrophomonas]KRG73099.1 TonB-dependent receptor [Stenotrophomonas chelatiphaga]MCS4230843.1 TonB-dependent receptor [Stenotrophomonas chelatiphaga]MDR6094241.1 iron complex outermembrane receptor protein [Stenotrophomonas sp. SORGH_AS_0321]ROQ48398.1 TonB-dependent receptor [Stenotrophomonas maltophilia]